MSAQANNTGDNAELEDLFDSIALAPKKEAAPATVTPLRPVVAAIPAEAEAADSADLEELFDNIANAMPSPGEVAGAAMMQPPAADAALDPASQANKVINSIGHLTRQLHDTLAELGYDRHLQEVAAGALPDARQRIAYVVQVTEQAASRSLNAVELATPVQEKLAADAKALGSKWDAVFDGTSNVADFKALAESTREYLKSVPAKAETTREQLREVMMAQEFQDLTGQVLKRVTEVANDLERQLLTLLVEHTPVAIKKSEALGLLNGPQIDGAAPDVVADQAQVDDLLESLGF